MDTTSISTRPIPLQDVKSSQIHSIGHDPETNTLAIRFYRGYGREQRPGSLYHYANVDAAAFAAFRDAESLGRLDDLGLVVSEKDDAARPCAKDGGIAQRSRLRTERLPFGPKLDALDATSGCPRCRKLGGARLVWHKQSTDPTRARDTIERAAHEGAVHAVAAHDEP